MSEGFLDDVNDEEEPETIEAEVETVEEGVPEARDGSTGTAAPGDSFVKPVSNPEEVVEMYEQFDQLKADLLNNEDTTPIGDSVHINKSGWRKFATLFNLSIETFEEERTLRETGEDQNDVVVWRIKAKATAPNGKVSVGSGLAASNESNYMVKVSDHPAIDGSDHPNALRVDGKWRVLLSPAEVNEHNIYATAETRAKNRAISDMVGGGEVSAEEMDADHFL